MPMTFQALAFDSRDTARITLRRGRWTVGQPSRQPNGSFRRILPVSACPDEGHLTESKGTFSRRGGNWSSCPFSRPTPPATQSVALSGKLSLVAAVLRFESCSADQASAGRSPGAVVHRP